MHNPAWLPRLICMSDHNNVWSEYIDAVYAKFQEDFLDGQAKFQGQPVRIGSQLIDGKERTFWHVTSEGRVEDNRTPDLRRCERIGWIRAIIDNEQESAVLSWPQARGRNQRQVLWVKGSNFAVVLDQRLRCWWLWTAYPTDRDHTQRKLMREYETWKKANAAP